MVGRLRQVECRVNSWPFAPFRTGQIRKRSGAKLTRR